jgi:serine/threonine protein kinase
MMLAAGTRFGPYEILSALGAGGMGEVYKARDTRLDRTVALKILPSTDDERRQRFAREAKAIAALSHPNICTLHDVGHQDGTDFLVVEYLEGETLADRLKTGPLELPMLLDLAVQIADALDTAHAARIFHRDLKPHNIIVTRRGQARSLISASRKPERRNQPTRVRTSRRCWTEGSPAPAPRRDHRLHGAGAARGDDTDHRADIFSFGAVLRDGDGLAGLLATPAVIFDAILNKTPIAPRTLNPRIPAALETSSAGRWRKIAIGDTRRRPICALISQLFATNLRARRSGRGSAFPRRVASVWLARPALSC